ncbi:MAG: GAF domain-containing protein, partial [Nitrospinota bacterium]
MAKVRSSLLTVVVFLLAFSIGQALIISIKRARQAEQRRALLETASNYASSLQRQLERSLSSTFALASLVQRGQGHVENFELLAATLIAFHEGLRSLQLAPKGVVSHVYPLTGNETILGRDLFKDPRCRAQVMRSMQSGELSLTSPFALPQGGQGIMGHLPVFLSSSTGKKVFWGFTVAVLRLSDLLEGSHINLLPEAGYAYELSARRPESQERIVLARSGKLIPSQATSVSIAVPAGHWTLSLSLPSSPFPLGAAHLLVGLCSLLIASFAYRMARQPEVLRQRIAQRTQELARQKRSEKLLLEQMKHLQTMQEVTKEITRELNLISLLHLISQRAAALVGVSSGAIFLWEEATQELVPQFWPDHWGCMEGRRLRLGEGVVGTVARRRAGMIVNDYRSSPYALSTALERGGVQAVLAEPLLYRDRLLGVIVLQTEQAHQTFSEQDRQILSLFAGQAAIAIENARLHETTLQHAQQLTMLNELTRTLTMVLDPRRVAQQ